MPYSKLKKNDIFVSYAHYDDPEGWVKNFGIQLKNKMKKQLNLLDHIREANVTVWTDASLPSSGALSNGLKQAITDSALFMVIMSVSYLESEWCQKEGEMFIDGLKGNRELKIFIAEKEKTDRNRWPKYLKDKSGSALLSQVFYEETHAGIYKTIPIKDRSGEFNSEAGDLIENLCVSICKELQNQDRNSPTHLGGNSKRVFLALCSSDDGDAENYMQELQKSLGRLSNIELLPALKPQEFENSLAERLSNSDLFVQILDSQKGAFLSGRKTGFVGHQYEEAQAKHIPILQWKVPGLASNAEPKTPYQQFLASLKQVGEEGGTLVSGESLDAFFAEIKAALEVERNLTGTKNRETINVEIRSLLEDANEAKKVSKIIEERSKIWNQDRRGEEIQIDPIFIHKDPKPEDIDLLAKVTKGTVIVYARNLRWVFELKERIKANRIRRIAKCDPASRDINFGSQIDISSDANTTERDQEIDRFLEELASALTTNR